MSEPAAFYEPQETEDTKPSYELYIKASTIDGESKGACPLCQQWFMISYLLAQNNDVKFRVYTVNTQSLPKSFEKKLQKQKPSQYPVVIGLSGEDQNGQDLSSSINDCIDDVEKFFDEVNAGYPLLKRSQQANLLALRAVEDITKKFNLFIKNEFDDGTKLTAYLKKIDEHLESLDGKFLAGNTICYADCYFMPRLQHLRIAGATFKNYRIPEGFTHLWDYMENMYATSAFYQTMPSDQDIVSHYLEKSIQSKVHRPKLEKTTFTTSVERTVQKDSEENGDEGVSVSSEEQTNGD